MNPSQAFSDSSITAWLSVLKHFFGGGEFPDVTKLRCQMFPGWWSEKVNVLLAASGSRMETVHSGCYGCQVWRRWFDQFCSPANKLKVALSASSRFKLASISLCEIHMLPASHTAHRGNAPLSPNVSNPCSCESVQDSGFQNFISPMLLMDVQ